MFINRRIFSVFARFSSTNVEESAKTKASRMKRLHSETKKLFGPVASAKKKTKNVPVENIKQPANASKNDLTSEMYWLLQHSQQPKPNNIKLSKVNSSSSKSEPVKEFATIPFTDHQLKSLLQVPLIYEKHPFDPEGTTTIEKYPSVGKILQATMPDAARIALQNWKARKIAELGEEGFALLQTETLNQGKRFHEALQTYLLTGDSPAIDELIEGVWESIRPALNILQPKVEFAEAPLEHPLLKYRGIVDCVSTIGPDISVIEWKKSARHKQSIASTFDAPLQLCAYLGALSADSRYNLVAKKGFVVVAYTDGSPANIHRMEDIDLRKYWSSWLRRVQEFWIRTRDGTLPEPI